MKMTPVSTVINPDSSNITSHRIKSFRFPVQNPKIFASLRYSTIAIPIRNNTDIIVKVYYENKGAKQGITYQPERFDYPNPILLKGSPSTRFTYKVIGLSSHQIDRVNSLPIDDISGRLKLIDELGGCIEFHYINDYIFDNNLEAVDTQMKILLADALVFFYRDQKISCEHLIKQLSIKNSLNYDDPYSYHIKLRVFLSMLVFGLGWQQEWLGYHFIKQGYKVHYPNCDVICFYVNDRNNFQDSLVENTILDTPDPILCKYGNIYKKTGEDFIDLCLQIRLN